MKKLTNYIIICVAFTSCVNKTEYEDYSCVLTLTNVRGNTCTGNDTTITDSEVIYEVESGNKEYLLDYENDCMSGAHDWTDTRFPTSSTCESFIKNKIESVFTKI
jgi:hypothetical protein